MKGSIPSFVREDCISIQDVQQSFGWGLTAFNLSKAWDYSQGEGIVIAVIDTGCDLTHPDLKNNLVEGKNFVEKGKPPVDVLGHGTAVAGILVAENNDFGIVGICPKAKVMPIKALGDDGNGNMGNISAAIRWASNRKVDFISLSLGTPVPIQHVHRAIQYAVRRGVVTFVASGNAGADNLYYPAAYPEVIPVGAHTQEFTRAGFSNLDISQTFLAPGVDVYSTVPPGWYAKMSGTSMAQPFMCGLAALVKSYMIKHNKPVFQTASEYQALFSEYLMPSSLKIVDPRLFFEKNPMA